MQHFTTLDDAELIQAVQAGAVGILPTDTVYGVVAKISDGAAVDRLYGLKQRVAKPGTIIAADSEQLIDLGLKARYLKAVENYWPGAVTVVIPAGPELAALHKGSYSLAVRIPADQYIHSFLKQTGPLMTTSANRPGEPPANDLKEAQAYFEDAVDFYVDGGNLKGHQPSTIIRMVDDAVEVLRPGAVTIDEATGRVIS